MKVTPIFPLYIIGVVTGVVVVTTIIRDTSLPIWGDEAQIVTLERPCQWQLGRGVVITSPRDHDGDCRFDNLMAALKADENQ